MYVLLIWLCVALTFLVIRRIIRSRLGRALEAIREDELAAATMGINVVKYKIISFTIGAFFAGLAGSLWAIYNKSVTPQSFDIMLSIMILCMVVLGGMGNQWGAILGAVIVVLASEMPRLIGITNIISPQVKQVVFGLILVLMMIFKPQGILGRKKPNFERLMENNCGKE
jgi:branched-chain amino acid transport system permease protein